MLDSLNLTEVSALLTMIFTCIITIANMLMWLSTRRTIALQTASNYSLNYQSLIQGHRDLLFGLMNQPEVLQVFAKANKFDSEQWSLQSISTFFINHAWIHYVNFAHGTLDRAHLESFKKDAQDMFTWPSVYTRWQQAKTFYPENFRNFVENELLINISVDPDGPS
ncbi:MAG: hypothetical protein F6J95_003530 [Leptolyngbya sp. SIO1E4]|nr:hypothetical protein [Leptolyngbya sp. SIO1E4]